MVVSFDKNVMSLHHVWLTICALQPDLNVNHELLSQPRLGKTPDEGHSESADRRNVNTVTWYEKDVGFVSSGRGFFCFSLPLMTQLEVFWVRKTESVHAIQHLPESAAAPLKLLPLLKHRWPLARYPHACTYTCALTHMRVFVSVQISPSILL